MHTEYLAAAIHAERLAELDRCARELRALRQLGLSRHFSLRFRGHQGLDKRARSSASTPGHSLSTME